ncbi:MAG: PqqD family protein [Prevotella sp.]|nr:PqqD family protein [Prevotella sp.]
MKTKQGFRLRNICGENVIVAEGIDNIDFSKIISMNESAAYLWQKVEGQPFTVEDLTRLLCEEYDIDEATAHKDSETVAQQWIEAGIAEE